MYRNVCLEVVVDAGDIAEVLVVLFFSFRQVDGAQRNLCLVSWRDADLVLVQVISIRNQPVGDKVVTTALFDEYLERGIGRQEFAGAANSEKLARSVDWRGFFSRCLGESQRR